MLVDTHCHLADQAFADVSATLTRARTAGVTRVIAVGGAPESNRAVLALARRHEGVRPAFGFHPERFDLDDAVLEEVFAQLEAARSDLVAVGEIGLPWYGLDRVDDAAMVRAHAVTRLVRSLAVARRLELPVLLHAPHGAADQARRLLAERPVAAAVFHWHKAESAVTRAILESGSYLGITPEVVYRERDRRLVAEAPLDQLLPESDGPWAYAGPFGGRPGEPAMVRNVATAVAAIRGLPVEAVTEALAANAQRCFGPGL